MNTDSGMREVNIGCDITFNTVKNNQSSLHKVTSSTYDGVYTVTFDIMKNICGNEQEDLYMTPDEVRHIVKWLNRRDYHKFKMYGDDHTTMSLVYFGSFNVKQIMLGTKTIGLSLTFTSNSPYALAEKKTVGFNVSEENQKIYLFGDGDEYGNIYPVVKILFKKACDEFTITNHNTSTTMYLSNCKEGEMITIDGEHKIITTDNNTHKNTLYNDFNYEYLNIFIDDGDYNENEYEVSSPCLITFEYYPVRKVGVY
jgi:hypothetical protein